MEKTGRRTKIAGQIFVLDARDIVRAVRRLDPEPIASHYVVIGARRYPPKQVMCAVTGLDRADLTTHQARRTLMRLGFPVGRKETPGRTRAHSGPGGQRLTTTASPEALADRLRSFTGQWVAIKDDDVLHAATSPHALVGWLSEHDQSADSVFRVPEDELAGSGLAPL